MNEFNVEPENTQMNVNAETNQVGQDNRSVYEPENQQWQSYHSMSMPQNGNGINNAPKGMTKEEERIANILCLISVACEILPLILDSIFTNIFQTLTSTVADHPEVVSPVHNFLQCMVGVMMIAGFAIMVYVRIKYPKHILGKVLMILYSIALVLIVIGIIVMIIACSLACGTIFNGCQYLG